MRYFLVLLSILVICPICTSSGEEIFLPTDQDLSPDGKTVVFSWRGDIWSAPVEGGASVQLTAHPADDDGPCFSPDGKNIAFTSDRCGRNQIFIMPVEGGSPERLTFHSEGYTLIEWTGDGTSLLVSCARDQYWRDSTRLFLIDSKKRGPEKLLFNAGLRTGVLSPAGDYVLFTREGHRRWRKGYVGPQASQIWLYDIKKDTYEVLLNHDRESWEPLWKPDGSGFYFVSGESGSFNLWNFDLKTKAKKQLTFFEDDSVCYPCISRDGSTIVFRHLFDLYRFYPAKGGEPKKITLLCNTDMERVINEKLSTKSASNVSFSKDGLEAALIAGGDLWVMDTEFREPKRITNTPGDETEILFMPDGNSILFVSDVEGRVDLWRAERGDAEKYWWLNDSFKLTRITNDDEPESALSASPDGKKIAYIKGNGDFWISNSDGLEARKLFSSWSKPDYDWSPDGKWIVYSVDDNEFNNDIWVRPIDNSREPFNLSRHPDNDSNPVWSPDGKIIAFTGMRSDKEVDIYFVWLTKEDNELKKRERTMKKALEKMEKARKKKGSPKKGSDKVVKKDEKVKEKGKEKGKAEEKVKGDPSKDKQKKEIEKFIAALEKSLSSYKGDEGAMIKTFLEKIKTLLADLVKPAVKKKKDDGVKVKIDFDGICDRIKRVSIPNSYEGILLWSPDSKKLAFSARIDGKSGIYTLTFPDDLKPKLLTTKRGYNAKWLKEGNKIVWLADGSPSSLSSSGKSETYSFNVKWESNIEARKRAGFIVAWRHMRDSYYDANLNNRDWNKIRKKYEDKAAKSPDMKIFGTIVTMLLGELNGSHLGFYSRGRGGSWSSGDQWRVVTAHFGVRYDESYNGPGLKVKDVIPSSPADMEKSRILQGEIIEKIDNIPVNISMDLTTMLNGPSDRDVHLTVKSNENETREVIIRPFSYSYARSLLRKKWLEDCRTTVDKGSNNTIGYLHIPGMNWSSFLEFERELYAQGAGKDGLIIDVRNNGGGFTADHLLTAICQPLHAITVPRGGGPGYPQDRMVYATWRKPIVVLCNQNSFSNAEIFSHAVKILKRGKLVGVRTAGGVISTGSARVMNIGSVRMPFRGWFKADDGQDQELNGAIPDYEIWHAPGDIPIGKDVQLDKAVEVLLEEIKKGDKLPTPVYRQAK